MTCIVAVGAYFAVYNYPATAGFLTQKEREFIHFRLKNDSDATRDEKFSWENVSKAFEDPKVWLYAMGFHTLALPLYTLSLFLVDICPFQHDTRTLLTPAQPTIIRDLGYSAAQAQLLTVPPYAFAFIVVLTVAILSERTHRRAPFIAGSSALAIVGYIILLTQNRPGVSYFGTILAAGGIYPATASSLRGPRKMSQARRNVPRPTRCRSRLGTWVQC